MIPIDLLKEYLKQIEETQLLELLDIKSEDLVEMFEEKIRERRKYLEGEVEALPEPQEAADEQRDTFMDDEDLYEDE